MKLFIATLLFILPFISWSQKDRQVENDLISAFARINYYWQNSDKDPTDDSLTSANNKFEQLLLKYTSTISETLDYSFKNLRDSGLTIYTSADKKFRIYTWNTLTGGTMQFYRTIFQFKGTKGTYSKTTDTSMRKYDDPGCFYLGLFDIKSGKKTFYLAINVVVGSSADFEHSVKFFAINGELLNDKVKLIMTNAGLRNEIGYEIDLNHAGKSMEKYPNFEIMYPQYDDKHQTIILPLVNGEGEVTERKIKYQFDGSYFRKK